MLKILIAVLFSTIFLQSETKDFGAGLTGWNSIKGTNNDDSYTAGDNWNRVYLGKGDNSLTIGNAPSSSSKITAKDGDDTVKTGDGWNLIDLGGGDNTLTSGKLITRIDVERGDDKIVVGNSVTGWSEINLGDGDNTLIAGDNWNKITAKDGDDIITVGNGSAYLDLGEGDDRLIVGDSGSSWTKIEAGDGDDIISAGKNFNRINLGDGDDNLAVGDSGSGWTKIEGGDGDDTISICENWTEIQGGKGEDTVIFKKAKDKYKYEDKWGRIFLTDLDSNSKTQLQDVETIKYGGDCKLIGESSESAKSQSYNCAYTSSFSKALIEKECNFDEIKEKTDLPASDFEYDLKRFVDIEKPKINSKTFTGKTTISTGSYYYDSVTFKSDAIITISGDVKIYADIVHINQKAEINCGGEAKNLFIGSFNNNMIINKDSKISANLFVNGKLQVKKDTGFKGLIVTTDKQTGISYFNKSKVICSGSEPVTEKLIKSDAETIVNIRAGQSKILDPLFKTGGKDSIFKLGVIEITDSNSSPANINYIKYDEVLVKKLNLEVEEFANNGQILFKGELPLSDWETFFKTVKFVAPKSSTLTEYKHSQNVRWDDGKKICKNKGMKLPSKEELQRIPNLSHGEYWTNKEISSSWAYMFRPPNWTQSMQKNNHKSLYCVKQEKIENQNEDTSFKVIFTIKNFLENSEKGFQLGAVPTKPETTDSLTSTLKKWSKDGVEVKGYHGDRETPLTVITTDAVLKNPNSRSGLGYHKSTGLGVGQGNGQILWAKNSSLPGGGLAQKIIIKFKEPIVDVQVGFTGLGGRFINSAKAVYEFYYKNKLVRSRGKLDRSADFDGDGFVATNIVSTDMIVDKMIFTIEIEGDNKSNANYSVRYIVGTISGDDSIFTKIFKVNIIDVEDKEDVNTSYSFKIVDSGKDENITTKIAGEEFKLDIIVSGATIESKDKKTDKKSILTNYKHPANLRWHEAEIICKNKNMKLPTIEEFKNIQNLAHGEYWTNQEINSNWAFMFRPSNWSQPMQKVNHKAVYCIGDSQESSNSSSDEVLETNTSKYFNGTIEIKFINSSIPPQKVTFSNENKKTIALKSLTVSKNVGIAVFYENNLSYSDDNFSIRPKKFVISVPKSVISGKGFDLNISVKDSSEKILTGYSETNSSVLNFKYSELKPNCLRGDLNISEVSITNGIFSKLISYPEVGGLNISISENSGYEFAKIDENDGSGNNRFIEPTSTIVDFNISKIISELSLNNSDGTYTYIGNDLNETKATLYTNLKVLNYKNRVVKNFCKSCYSEDMNSRIFLEIDSQNESLTMFGDSFSNQKINTTLETNLMIEFNISKELFLDGEFNKTLKLNFKRKTDTPLDPIFLTIIGSNIIIPEIQQFDFEDNISANHKDANFYYGRVVIEDQEVTDMNRTITYAYEIYLSDINKTILGVFGENKISENWYEHLEVNRSRYNSKISLRLSNISQNIHLTINGTIVSLIDEDDRNKKIGINIDAPQYLLYNRYDENLEFGNFDITFQDEVELEEGGIIMDTTNRLIKITPNSKTNW